MNYQQFIELDNLLKENNLSVSEWKNGNVLLEAVENELETEKGYVITKRGRTKRKLNKKAKKLNKRITNLLDKHVDAIFREKTKLFNRAAALSKKEQPKEILDVLNKDVEKVKNYQNKKLDVIKRTAEQMIERETKSIEEYIENRNLREKTKNSLMSYWDALSAQIELQLLNRISKKEGAMIDKVLRDPKMKALAKKINNNINKRQQEIVKDLENELKTKKKSFMVSDKAAEKEDEEEIDPKELRKLEDNLKVVLEAYFNGAGNTTMRKVGENVFDVYRENSDKVARILAQTLLDDKDNNSRVISSVNNKKVSEKAITFILIENDEELLGELEEKDPQKFIEDYTKLTKALNSVFKKMKDRYDNPRDLYTYVVSYQGDLFNNTVERVLNNDVLEASDKLDVLKEMSDYLKFLYTYNQNLKEKTDTYKKLTRYFSKANLKKLLSK